MARQGDGHPSATVPDTASIVVRLFAEAHTVLAAIKTGRRL
ncbi:MAG TPA: hypothetical protein VFP81_08830 [Propionibacteriaceae bacterium]|nr:hypothetical protein [Propionibacteriaceae bacterium]